MVKYQFLGNYPAQSVYIREKEGKQPPRKITFEGEGDISDEDFKAIKDIKQVRVLVREGVLRFPKDKDMEVLFRSREADRAKRIEAMSADQDERKEAKAERLASQDEVKALEKENAELRKIAADTEARLAKLEKAATKEAAKAEGGKADATKAEGDANSVANQAPKA